MTAGFGAGSNGPLLISVDMSKQPAKADQKQIDKINSGEQDDKDKAKQQAQQQEQQLAGQLEAQGMPPAQAQSQAQAQVQPQLDKQLDKITDQADQPAQEGEAAGDRPAVAGPARRRQEDGRRQVGHGAAGQQGRHGGGAQRDADDRSRPTDATADLVERLRDTTIPKAEKGNDMTVDVGGRPPATSISRPRSAAG